MRFKKLIAQNHLQSLSKQMHFLQGTAVNERGLATLAYEEVIVRGQGSDDTTSSCSDSLRTALVIHGLFGIGRNWRSPAKSMAEFAVQSQSGDASAFGWRMVLVDLRNHGKSAQLSGLDAPHTIEAAGKDLVRLVGESGWGGVPVVIGHSLGGKVALEYAKLTHELGNVSSPKQVWILDSVPGPVIEHGKGDVEKVLETLRSLPNPVPSRRWLTGHLQELGYSRGLAEWMASNLRKPQNPRTAEEMTWVFNVEEAAQMYDSYRELDYLPFLRSPPPGMQLDIVRAERSDRWHPEILGPLETLEKSGSIGLHLLPNAGHWLHMDNPKGLVQMLAPSLVRVSDHLSKNGAN